MIWRSTVQYIQVENHFYEMKGDVGMSSHEKEREQEDTYTKRESHSQPHPYIFVMLKTVATL